ncbi:unnamed protein product [Fraxinus pennsylvanica]|uniref:WRKY domain-containing protein n=1 Tax=Fraxinus pennsylvanica TaxID=56036 RepID=A0AAD1ZTQ0_9LAMI|nr:unnamed protein product [Fraxinus pennsylvanica]
MAHYCPSFELSDFLESNDWLDEEYQVFGCPQNLNYAADEVFNSSGISSSSSHQEGPGSRDGGSGREKKEITEKVAFKTKSEVEILDDGFKWRKYGKKMNSLIGGMISNSIDYNTPDSQRTTSPRHLSLRQIAKIYIRRNPNDLRGTPRETSTLMKL